MNDNQTRSPLLPLTLLPLPAALVLVSLYMAGKYFQSSETAPTRASATATPGGTSKNTQSKSATPSPSPTGLASFPSRRWDDPLKDREAAFEELKDSKGDQLTDILRSIIANHDVRLLVLPVLVDRGEDEDHVENRRRRRQAVETALSGRGFSLAYADRMTYFLARNVAVYFSDNVAKTFDIVVPIKIYQGPDRTVAMTIWIDEAYLEKRPLLVIAQIVKAVFRDLLVDVKKRGGLAIVGPSYSDTLIDMVKESLDFVPGDVQGDTHPLLTDIHSFFLQWAEGTKLFSPSATIPINAIPDVARHAISGRKMMLCDTADAIGIVCTIGDDEGLMERLDAELTLRGAMPNSSSDCILLIGDNDRVVSREFMKRRKADKQHNFVVVPYSFGVRAGAVNETAPQQSLSMGDDYRDYFQRTVFNLLDSNAGQLQTRPRILAVGVFGSTSDKLFIIQTLKPHFPQAIFFTTDLDARLTDGPMLETTRGLLVASHFGLTLEGTEMPEMAPFRDSYQTSDFLATWIALKAFGEHMLAQDAFPVSQPEFSVADLFDPYGRLTMDPLPKDPTSKGDSKPGCLETCLFEVARNGVFQFRGNATVTDGPVRQPQGADSITGSIRWSWAALIIGAISVVAVLSVLGPLSRELQQMRNHVSAVIKALQANVNVIPRRFRLSLDRFRRNPKIESLSLRPEVNSSFALMKGIWFTICAVGLTAIVMMAVADDASTNGEPLSLTKGISCWPSIFIFGIVALVAGLHLIGNVEKREQLIIHVKTIWQHCGTTEVERMTKFIEQRFGNYYRVPAIMFLSFAIAGIFIALQVFLRRNQYYFGSSFIVPGRSPEARWIGTGVSFLGWVMLLILASQVLYLGMVVRALLHSFRTPGIASLRTSPTEDALTVVEEIGSLTRMVGTAILVPAGLALLFGIARLPYWDAWDARPAALLMVMLPIIVAILVSLIVRQVARSIRDDVLQLLERRVVDRLSRSVSPPKGGKKDEDNAKNLDNEIKQIREIIRLSEAVETGAFGSVYRDPLLGGVILLFTTFLTGPSRLIFNWAIGM